MIQIGIKQQSFFKEALRRVKVLINGKNDVQTPYESAPFGVDGVPPDGWRAIIAETQEKGKKVVIGYINKGQLEAIEKGEHRIYSTDSDGALSTFIHLLGDGTMCVAGDSDNAVRFSALKAVIEEIQNDLTTVKNAVTGWVPVPQDGGAALKAALASWSAAPITEDVDTSRIDEIKTP